MQKGQTALSSAVPIVKVFLAEGDLKILVLSTKTSKSGYFVEVAFEEVRDHGMMVPGTKVTGYFRAWKEHVSEEHPGRKLRVYYLKVEGGEFPTNTKGETLIPRVLVEKTDKGDFVIHGVKWSRKPDLHGLTVLEKPGQADETASAKGATVIPPPPPKPDDRHLQDKLKGVLQMSTPATPVLDKAHRYAPPCGTVRSRMVAFAVREAERILLCRVEKLRRDYFDTLLPLAATDQGIANLIADLGDRIETNTPKMVTSDGAPQASNVVDVAN